jgi:exopolysaccharide biosynthesis predicted pyruvyltransferase EpsI
VLDPTFLLSKSDYTRLLDGFQCQEKGKDIFCYLIHSSDKKQAIIQKASELLQCENEIFVLHKKSNNIDDKILPPIEYWLNNYGSAKYIITDSFHGTAFSIIFNVPFWVLTNQNTGITRLYSLLKIFGLENRIIHSVEEITAEKINMPVNWESVNKIHKEKREESLKFLEKLLKYEKILNLPRMA